MSGPAGRVLFGLVLAFCILTVWAPERWFVSGGQLAFYALAAIFLVSDLRGAVRPAFPPVMALIAVVPLCGIFQVLFSFSAYRWTTEMEVLNWFTRLVVFWLAYRLFAGHDGLDRALDWAIGFAACLSVVAVLQWYTSTDKIFWLFPTGAVRAMGPFPNPNQYAAFLETLLPAAMVGAVEGGRRRPLYYVAAAVMVSSVITSGARAGSLILPAEIVLVIALLWARKRIAKWRAVSILAAATVIVAAFTVAAGWRVLAGRLEMADTWGARTPLAVSTLHMIGDRPLTGYGLGAWPEVYPAYATFDDGLYDNQAHNDWLQWGAEGGVPFLVVMVVFAASLARAGWRNVWGIGLLAVLAHCLVDYHLHQRAGFGYYYFALAGACAAQVRGAWKPGTGVS